MQTTQNEYSCNDVQISEWSGTRISFQYKTNSCGPVGVTSGSMKKTLSVSSHLLCIIALLSLIVALNCGMI